MLNNLAYKLTIFEESTDLLWQWALLVVILFSGWRKVDIDARTLAGIKLGVQAIFRQVYRSTIDLVQHDCWKALQDLEGKVWTLDNID